MLIVSCVLLLWLARGGAQPQSREGSGQDSAPSYMYDASLTSVEPLLLPTSLLLSNPLIFPTLSSETMIAATPSQLLTSSIGLPSPSSNNEAFTQTTIEPFFVIPSSQAIHVSASEPDQVRSSLMTPLQPTSLMSQQQFDPMLLSTTQVLMLLASTVDTPLILTSEQPSFTLTNMVTSRTLDVDLPTAALSRPPTSQLSPTPALVPHPTSSHGNVLVPMGSSELARLTASTLVVSTSPLPLSTPQVSTSSSQLRPSSTEVFDFIPLTPTGISSSYLFVDVTASAAIFQPSSLSFTPLVTVFAPTSSTELPSSSLSLDPPRSIVLTSMLQGNSMLTSAITQLLPSTTLPSASLPSTTLPSASLLNTTLPSATLPSATLPSATLPSTTLPSAILPSAAVSSAFPTLDTSELINTTPLVTMATLLDDSETVLVPFTFVPTQTESPMTFVPTQTESPMTFVPTQTASGFMSTSSVRSPSVTESNGFQTTDFILSSSTPTFLSPFLSVFVIPTSTMIPPVSLSPSPSLDNAGRSSTQLERPLMSSFTLSSLLSLLSVSSIHSLSSTVVSTPQMSVALSLSITTTPRRVLTTSIIQPSASMSPLPLASMSPQPSLPSASMSPQPSLPSASMSPQPSLPSASMSPQPSLPSASMSPQPSLPSASMSPQPSLPSALMLSPQPSLPSASMSPRPFLPSASMSPQPSLPSASMSPRPSLLSQPRSAAPSPTVSPQVGCPSFLEDGESIPSSSLVELRLGLTMLEHSVLSMATSQERCELEDALIQAIFGTGEISKRQATTQQRYNADITEVGALFRGTALISFYIINATATPSFIPAMVIITAIQTKNLTQILSYPIIGVEAPPTDPTSLVVPLAAGLGVALFLLVIVAVVMSVCVSLFWYKGHKSIKVETLRGAEAAATFARTNDFERLSGEASTSSRSAVAAKDRKEGVSISQLANGWAEGGAATPTTPSSRHDPIPAGFFERVAHYESATPPQPSPSTRVLKMKFRNSIAPSPSTSNKSQNSEVATPAALRPHHSGEDMIQSKEDSLRMQELKEEEELKARRKATLERLKVQSRQRDSGIRSRVGSRRRKRRGSINADTTVRPSTYGGVMQPYYRVPREAEVDAVMGDVDSSSPFATHVDTMATTPRPTTRPSTKRRAARRKGNKVAPQATTDDYDSTDHAPHPYHMMLDPRSERKLLASRTSSRQKQGRSQRGRPFSREQSHLTTSGRRSRAIGRDVQRELAWMETPGGVQLMRIQPILPATAAPTYTLPPPHPTTAPGHIITVQPRPHPKAMAPPPRHSTLDNLPALAPPSQNFTHKQLETLWREIEKFQLDQTMRKDSSGYLASNKATPTKQSEDKVKHSNEPAHSVGEGGEPCDPGEAGEASTEVKSKEKGESATSIQPTQVNESGTSAVAEQPSPATPLGSARPNIPDVDSSYSSAVIQELLQQAFSASQSQGAGQTWARSTNSNSYQVDSVDSGANLLFPQGQSHTSAAGPGAPTAGAWHTVMTSQAQGIAPPTQVYAAPPTHFNGLPGQLVWAPPDPQSFTPLHTQVISPGQLSQLRQSQSYHQQEYDQSNLVSYGDPFHTPASPQFFSPYSRYSQHRRHDPFS